ncbi:WbqC family protein [Massilia oculi]|uniref:WbqC family protein n=1 Tax=Massilia hydrophila TaxID=3044279 RepID=A0ABS7Y6K2_9BURK|nr:WbqC family protein [Massilia oculi]MCA1854617.1 WbqC family protein [Massilia oculi]
MKLAIMQPYFFPYLGYFQLIASVDKFVFYDDVNFIKNGWINRNRLYLAGATRYITVPLAGASPFLKINEIQVQQGEGWRRKIAESVRHSYSRAPYFAEVGELLHRVLFSSETKIGDTAKASITEVCAYLDLAPEFVASSTVYGNAQLTGAERVLDICAQEGARHYYNPPGGRELYNDEEFNARDIGLHFIHPELKPYPQFAEQFEPGLSIIDVLMFNDRETVKAMIQTGERP